MEHDVSLALTEWSAAVKGWLQDCHLSFLSVTSHVVSGGLVFNLPKLDYLLHSQFPRKLVLLESYSSKVLIYSELFWIVLVIYYHNKQCKMWK